MWNPYSALKMIKPPKAFECPEDFNYKFLFVFWEEISLGSSDLKRTKSWWRRSLLMKFWQYQLQHSAFAQCWTMFLLHYTEKFKMKRKTEGEGKRVYEWKETKQGWKEERAFRKVLWSHLLQRSSFGEVLHRFECNKRNLGLHGWFWSRNGFELCSHLCYTITQFRRDQRFGVMKVLSLEEMKKIWEVDERGEGNNSEYVSGKSEVT